MLLSSLVELVLPLCCLVCGAGGTVWCEPCRPAPRPVAQNLGGLPVVSVGDYSGAVRTALLAYKERGHRALAGPLAALLDHAVAELGHHARDAPPILVPIPSQRAAARQRGGDHVARLVRALPQGRTAAQVLESARGRRDSAGLTRSERMANQRGRLRASVAPRALVDRPVVLVDDIVTSGATLREAARALTERGWSVGGAATIAATARWQT